jgi:hypothetical protein
MTDYAERIYPYPSVVRCCLNCPGFNIHWSAGSMKLYRTVGCKVYDQPITREMMEKAMDGEFPSFCKLEVVK